MKKSTLTLASWVIATLVFTFTSCSKYEEGPGLSLRSKTSRVAGDWKVTSFTEDGINIFQMTENNVFDCMSGSTFDYTITTTINDYNVTFDKDGGCNFASNINFTSLDFNTSYINCSPSYTNNTQSYTDTGKWEFASDKEDIKITYSDGSVENWKIIELREKEMKLEMTTGSTVDKMTLEKK